MSRNSLHKSKLQEYIEFCESKGWEQVKAKSCWEVLRMTNPQSKNPLIVHTKLDAPEHYTTHGVSHDMWKKYAHEKRVERKANKDTEPKPKRRKVVFSDDGRVCNACRKAKSWDMFYKKASGVNGYSAQCIPCEKEAAKGAKGSIKQEEEHAT